MEATRVLVLAAASLLAAGLGALLPELPFPVRLLLIAAAAGLTALQLSFCLQAGAEREKKLRETQLRLEEAERHGEEAAQRGPGGFCHLPLQSIQQETGGLSEKGLPHHRGVSERRYGLRLCGQHRPRGGDLPYLYPEGA